MPFPAGRWKESPKSALRVAHLQKQENKTNNPPKNQPDKQKQKQNLPPYVSNWKPKISIVSILYLKYLLGQGQLESLKWCTNHTVLFFSLVKRQCQQRPFVAEGCFL